MPEANSSDFPSRYDPKPVEGRWYQFWEKSGFFTADAQSKKPKFSIVIPPPNITGSLHVGHALNNSLQDAQIRFKKLQGFETPAPTTRASVRTPTSTVHFQPKARIGLSWVARSS
jgi:valyl-tRNA synthetase